MTGIEFIKHDGIDYAIILRADARSDKKYNFISPDAYPMQLGCNFYQPGEKIRSHYHLPRTTTNTMFQEFILVSDGRVKMSLFDLEQRLFGVFELRRGDAVLLVAGGHGFEVLDATKIVEIKQGPFDASVPEKGFIDESAT